MSKFKVQMKSKLPNVKNLCNANISVFFVVIPGSTRNPAFFRIPPDFTTDLIRVGYHLFSCD